MNSAADVWEKVKTLMEADMTSVSIDTWFGDAQAVALEDTRFLLCVSTDFKRDVIRSRFLPVIQKALLELFSFEVDVELLLPDEAEAYQQRGSGPAVSEDSIEEKYTFERFVVGSTNKFAYIAARRLPLNLAELIIPCSSTASPDWARPTFSTPLPTGSTGIFRATVSSISKARTLSTS